MNQAINLAHLAAQLGEVPIGAIVIFNNKIVGQAFNTPIARNNPIAHAEILALQAAGKTLANYRLTECELYVTVEPCAMCAGALIHSRIKRLIFGAYEPKSGAVCSRIKLLDMPFMNHTVKVTHGVQAEQCSAILSEFFAKRRRKQAR